MTNRISNSFLYKNGLSIVFLLLAVITVVVQVFTGISLYNIFLVEQHKNVVGFFAYLSTDHFIEATFQNWESKFISVFAIIFLSIYLMEIGSLHNQNLWMHQMLKRANKIDCKK